jgi:hypothetical protein
VKLRDRERSVARALRRFLIERGLSCIWRTGNDPPDFVFFVGRERWAVEETSLEQYVQGLEGTVEETTITAPIHSALVRLAQEVVEHFGGQPPAGYWIHCWAPTRALVGKGRDRVKAAAIAYIQDGRTEREQLDPSGAVRIKHIGPVHRFPVSVGLSASVLNADASNLHADIGATVRSALERIIDAKTSRVADLVGYDRKVLVISKRYLFADPQEVTSQLRALPLSRTAFDAVLYYTTDLDLGDMHLVKGKPQGEITVLEASGLPSLHT